MSNTTPAVAIASGTSFQMNPPAGGGTPWQWVVLTNLSPFVLLLQIQGAGVWQAPFSEARYLYGSASSPITVLPSTPAGATIPAGSGAQVQATWYAPGEPIEGTWPFSLTSSVQSATVLGNVTVTNFPATQAVSGTVAVSSVGGTVTVAPTPPTANVGTGQSVTAAGPTRTQLGSIACARGLMVSPLAANTAPVYIGNSAVTTANGLQIPVAATPIFVQVDNANRLYVIGLVGEGVSYLGI